MNPTTARRERKNDMSGTRRKLQRKVRASKANHGVKPCQHKKRSFGK